MVHVCVSFTCSLVYERRLMSPFVFRMFILPHSLILSYEAYGSESSSATATYRGAPTFPTATLSIAHWSPLSCSLSDCTADEDEEDRDGDGTARDSAPANQTQICV